MRRVHAPSRVFAAALTMAVVLVAGINACKGQRDSGPDGHAAEPDSDASDSSADGHASEPDSDARDSSADGDAASLAPDASASAPKVRSGELSPGVVMTYAAGGGITGKTIAVTVFADGRVERSGSGRPRSQVRVPVRRVEKLVADLAATGVFTQKDGSWKPRNPVPDGSGAQIVVRDEAGVMHTYAESTGATAPAVVTRAMRIGEAFAAEVAPNTP